MKNRSHHIIICSTSFHEYDRRLIRISDALKEASYQVTWISRTLGKRANNSSEKTNEIINTIFKRGILFYLEFNFRLFKKLLKYPHAIINSIDLDTLLAGWLAAKFSEQPLVFDAHEIFYEVPELEGKPFKKWIWKRLAKLIIPSIKHAYTVNNSLKQHYEKSYFAHFEVIRNVPPKTTFEIEQKSNQKKIIYLGVLNKGRGVEILIELMKQMPEYSLQLIGEGDLSNTLKKQAGKAKNVEFLGYKKPDEIFSILSQASIGINILDAQSLNYKLSLANKFFDYLHAGIPSINMAFPEYLNILSDFEVGVTINDYDLDSLKEAIVNLEDTELYQELSTNCIKYRDNFTWEKESKKLIDIYKGITD